MKSGGLVLCVLAMLLTTVDAQTAGRERRQERRAAAAEEYPELSQDLQNPLARILVLPTAFEYADGGGMAGKGEAFTIRFGPRIPFCLNDRWHLLSKSDLTYIWQNDVIEGSRQEGFGDFVQTFFFSPDRSLAWDIYWGVGPTFALPTATRDVLGSGQFSVGPSFGFFRQRDQLTTGVIMNHLWSVSGDSDGAEVNASRIEPLVAYTFPTATTLSVGAEFSYNWKTDAWTGPMEMRLTQLTVIKDRPIQWGLGVRSYPFNEPGEPEWGLVFQLSFPFDSSG